MALHDLVVAGAETACARDTSNSSTLDQRLPTPFRAARRRGWRSVVQSFALFAAVGFGAIGLAHAAVASDITWPQGSTQFVNSTLTISNLTLCIEPGVTVRVSPGASIVVSGTGTLEVVGTDDEPVLFTVDGAGRWNGIQFQADSRGSMRHATIEKVIGTGLSIANASPWIESCTIHDVLGTGGFARGVLVTGAAAHPVILRNTVSMIVGNAGTVGGNGTNGGNGPDGDDGTFFSPNGKNAGNGGNGGTGVTGGAGGGAIGIDVAAGARPGISSTRVDLVTGGTGGKGGNGGAGGDGGDGGTPVDGVFPGNGGNAGDGGNGGTGGVGGMGGFAIGMRLDAAGSSVPYQNIVALVSGGLAGAGGNGGPGGDGGFGGPGISFSLTPAFNTDGGNGGDGGNSGSGGAGGTGGVGRLVEVVGSGSSLQIVQGTLAETKGGNGAAGGFQSFSVGFAGLGGGAVSPGVEGGDGSSGSTGGPGATGSAGAREGARVASGSTLTLENSIVALGGAASGTAFIASGSGVINCATSCVFGHAALSTGNVNLLAGTILADPMLTSPASGDVSLASGSPCIDVGATSIVPYRRVATSFLGATEISEGAAYDEFFPGIPGGGCLLMDPLLPVTIALDGGMMTVTGLTSGGAASCAVVDGSTGPQVSDASLTSGTATLRIEFDPPARGFHSFFGSVAVGAAPRMRVFSGATLVADVVGAASPSAGAASGLGVSRLGETFDRVDLSVNGDTAAIAGAFAGLVTNEPSLGTVTILGYAGPDGSTVEHDFGVAFDDGSPYDAAGLLRLVSGSGMGPGPLDIGALEFQIVDPKNPCPADLNGDDIVDGADLGILLAAWGTSGPGDFNGNGIVDGGDLGLMLGSTGVCR